MSSWFYYRNSSTCFSFNKPPLGGFIYEGKETCSNINAHTNPPENDLLKPKLVKECTLHNRTHIYSLTVREVSWNYV